MCFTSLSYHGSMETSSTNLLVPYKLVIFHVLLPGGSVPRHANPGTEAHCVRCVGPHILEDSGARPAARPRHPAPLRRPRVVNIDPKKTGPKKTPRRLHRLGTLHLCHMAPRGQLMHLAKNLDTMMVGKSTSTSPGDSFSFRLRPFPRRPTSARSA